MGVLEDILAGLKNQLATIDNKLNAHAEAPPTIVTPAAFPMLISIDYDETMSSDVATYNLRIRLLVARVLDKVAQVNLYPYLSPSGSSSIRAAVDRDHTLGGVADWSRVGRVARFGDIEHAGQMYLGADFDLEVNADGA